jgi:hypothetical protein
MVGAEMFLNCTAKNRWTIIFDLSFASKNGADGYLLFIIEIEEFLDRANHLALAMNQSL